MRKHRSKLLGAAMLTALLVLSACNTTPPRPTPPPPPQAAPPPPPPPPSAQAQQHTAQPNSGSAGESAYMAPSEDAADVEVEEIPTDPQQRAMAQESQQAANAQADSRAGGGANSTGRAQPIGAPTSGADGASGTLAPAAIANDDLTGPRMNVGARTDDEQVAALDTDLTHKLAEFDELMRRAREEAERERQNAPPGSLAGSAGAPDGQGQRLDDSVRGGGGAATYATGSGNTPALVGASAAGLAPQVAAVNPPDIPDGRDDDIVARQLREAASKETDAVLKEKLWEEYRRYKAGL